MHTKEPWTTSTLVGSDTVDIMDAACDDFIATGASEENARRIVACVNACAGIETAALEFAPEGYLYQMLEQRDELLPALELMIDAFDGCHNSAPDDETAACSALGDARAAIAKAKG